MLGYLVPRRVREGGGVVGLAARWVVSGSLIIILVVLIC